MDIQVFHLSNGKLSNITFFSPQFSVQCRRKEQLELGSMLPPLMILQEVRKIRETRAKKGTLQKKEKAARENGYNSDSGYINDCIALRNFLPCISECYEDPDYQEKHTQPSFPSSCHIQYIARHPQFVAAGALVQAAGV